MSKIATSDETARARMTDLEEADIQILCLVAQGITDAEIGRRLSMSRGAVRYSIRRAMKRTGARNRPNLIAKVMAAGLLDLSEEGAPWG